jgi:hypothetical protein
MHRRTLLVSLAASGGLAGCGLAGPGRLEALTDPGLEAGLKSAMTAYAGQHPDLDWSLTATDPVSLLARAQAAGARVLVTRETKLCDNLQRTRRAPLENRWTLGAPNAPIGVVVTKGAGERQAKAFAEWLTSPEHRNVFEPVTAP